MGGQLRTKSAEQIAKVTGFRAAAQNVYTLCITAVLNLQIETVLHCGALLSSLRHSAGLSQSVLNSVESFSKHVLSGQSI